MVTGSDPFANITEDVVYAEILSKLGLHELARCTLVSREWNRLASNDRFWKELVPGIDAPLQGVRAYIGAHAVKSKDEMVQKVEEFAKKVQLHQKGTFICHFPFQQPCRIQITLGGAFPGQEEINNVAIAMRRLPSDRDYAISAQSSSPCFNCKVVIPKHTVMTIFEFTMPIVNILLERVEEWEEQAVVATAFNVAGVVLSRIQEADKPD